MSKLVRYPADFDARDKELMSQELYAVIEDKNDDDLDSGFLATYQDKASGINSDPAEPVYVATYRLVKIEAAYAKHTTEVVVVKE